MSVYMIWYHKPAPGRARSYSKLVLGEVLPWISSKLEEGLIKDLKICRNISGMDGAIGLFKFEDLGDVQKYQNEWDASGLDAKYKDVSTNVNTVLFQEWSQEEVVKVLTSMSTFED